MSYFEIDEDGTEQESAVYQVVFPDGTVKESPLYWLSQEAAPEYVVAVLSPATNQWSTRGWFSKLETAETLERNLKSYLPTSQVALLAVEGEIK